MQTNQQPSPNSKGEGRALRRARNVVKTFETAYNSQRNIIDMQTGREGFWVERYRRAKALLAYHALKNT